MRRSRQQLPMKEAEDILNRGTAGVLSLADQDGRPYGVPLSYLYAEGKLIFHCASAGRKLDCIAHDPRASFCVIGADDVVAQRYTTYYQSVIAQGRMELVADREEKIRLAMLLAEKYRPGFPEDARKSVLESLDHLTICILIPEEITGKEAIELTEKRNLQP